MKQEAKLKITPHEPLEELVGAEESFEDAKRLRKVREKLFASRTLDFVLWYKETAKANEQLRKMGMTILDDEPLRLKQIRFVNREDGHLEAVIISIEDFQRLVDAFGIMDKAEFAAALKTAKQTSTQPEKN
jgi:hypothetical protein